MTDNQDIRPRGGWQSPTVSVTCFVDEETRVSVVSAGQISGAWLEFKGDNGLTNVNVRILSRTDVVRARDALSAWLEANL